jgi:hypothetical protein
MPAGSEQGNPRFPRYPLRSKESPAHAGLSFFVIAPDPAISVGVEALLH